MHKLLNTDVRFKFLRLCAIGLLSLVTLYSNSSLAGYTCLSFGRDFGWSLSSTPLKSPSSANIGDSLGIVATASVNNSITCEMDMPSPARLSMIPYYAAASGSPQAPYFASNVSGVAYKLTVGSKQVNAIATATKPFNYYSNNIDGSLVSCFSNSVGTTCSTTQSVTWTLEAIKVGNVTAGQTLSTGSLPIAYLRHYDSFSTGASPQNNEQLSPAFPENWRYVYKISGVNGSGNMPPFGSPGTCSITPGTESFTINLPTVKAADFASGTYGYLVAGATPFNIQVNCSGDTGGTLKLSARDPNGSTHSFGVLNPATGNQSSNVRVQFLFDAQCQYGLPLGDPSRYAEIKTFTGAPTNTTIPVCARYAVTDGTKPKSGAVKAQMIYTVSYP